MTNCPKCGAEVEIGQKMCAWCGADLPVSAPPTAPPRPGVSRQQTEPAIAGESQDIPTIESARILAKAGDLTGAEKIFKSLLAEDPQDQEALFGLGGIHFKRGSKTQAAELWLRLKRLNPAYPHIDSWLNQVIEKINPPAPPTPAVEPPEESPPPRSAPRPSQQPFQPKQRTRRTPASPSQIDMPEGEDDWRKQSVRVMALEEPETEETIPLPEGKTKSTSSIPQPDKIAAWTRLVSWICVLLFGAAVALVYFVLPR